MSVTDTGRADARGGGTAVTGHRGPRSLVDDTGAERAVRVEGTGNATACDGAVVVTGYVGTLVTGAGARASVRWPVVVGAVPTLASGFQDRAGLRRVVDEARTGHTTVVLTQVLSGGGGVGKTQLAAAYAHRALAEGIDLVVWADAAEAARVTAAYAQAAHRVQAPGALGEDAENDARAFAEWLATTSRSWLVVLDDITDPDAIQPWWPPPSAADAGRVLATTRRRDAALSGGGRALVDITTYTDREADTYLRERLAGADSVHLLDDRAAALARELGLLPLALAHAAAYMINEAVPCADYLKLFAAGTARLDGLLPRHADTEGYGRHVAAALLLSLDAARHSEPVGLAAPALHLAALLDPAGHPRELWTTGPVIEYLAAHRTAPEPESARVDAARAMAALRVLHRYGLITDDPRAGHRAVRLHALTARAARETTSPATHAAAGHAAADALVTLWPDADHLHRDLTAVLRANIDTLATHAGDLVWSPEGCPMLHRSQRSLYDMGLYSAAITLQERMAADTARVFGPEHPETLAARGNLAVSYARAGRTGAAIVIEEQVLADRERLYGPGTPETLTARANLAVSYWRAGRTDDAIVIEEQVLADRERLFGSEHPETLRARANLGVSYWQADRIDDAIDLLERVVADAVRVLGPEHPETLTARGNLAVSYTRAGRTGAAIVIEEQVLADRERLLGPEHPASLGTRANLAASYRQVGRTDDAIVIEEQVLADRERLLGTEHPDTVNARTNLAASHLKAGHTDDAIALLERAIADSERLSGTEHPGTVATARALLTRARQGRP
ncbi:tetratricopeptide repeat protein [Embleya scabrispora]|uniref:tetratricopeptide repeat protein n=1 Tax=Embleya scabrispora TaxID=159449 RepID=UPI001319ED79|nr:tetratricopeptide repeat protein [Embleya scabrispora]MYS87853.1 tetratricopeptide repeat protein [Streptomyces sp. SID5474]